MADAPNSDVSAEGGMAAQYRHDAELLARAIEELERLDAASLRRRWRTLVGGAMPPDLGRPLTLRLLAYKLQVRHLGDLDKASVRELKDIYHRSRGMRGADNDERASSLDDCGASGAPASRPTKLARQIARPGTVLSRQYGGVLHRVLVLDEGVSWNGQTYASLSKVAAAITGTKWSGPRFFGLRDKVAAGTTDGACRLPVADKKVGWGRIRAAGPPRPSTQQASS